MLVTLENSFISCVSSLNIINFFFGKLLCIFFQIESLLHKINLFNFIHLIYNNIYMNVSDGELVYGFCMYMSIQTGANTSKLI